MKTTLSFKKQKTLVVAHRGLSGLETENTAAAFVAAGNRSYYGIETDIHRTTDGRYVCLHDDNTSRVSGVNCKVTECDYDKIKQIKFKDVSSGNGPREDLCAPLLEDYLSICKKYGKHCVLELKDVFTKQEMNEIIEIIKKADYLENVTFISFFPQNVYTLREILPEQSCQFLTDRLNDEVLNGIINAHVDIDILFTALTEENVKLLKSHGIAINCWTVNEVADGEKLSSWGVNYITTNILE